jgi:hypothetical protein
MSSLKQLIYNTLVKCATPASGTVPDSFETAEDARDSFIALVMAELFPEHGSSESAVVEVPVVEAAPVASPAKKLTKEEKEAAKAAKEAEKAAKAAEKEAAAKAKEEAKAAKAEAKAVKAASPKKSPEEKAAEKDAAKAAKEAEKAAAAKAKEDAKAAEKAAKEAAKLAEKAAKDAAKEAEKAAKLAEKEAAKAAKEAAKPAKVKSPKEAAKVVLPASPKPEVNLAKIDPTWRKALKEADKDHAKELEPELLKHLNALSNAGFHSKTAREHVVEFLASRAPAAEPAAPVDLEVVEFEGKEYYVNRETKRVYEGVMNDEGELTITRPVGYVGMADFKNMELEDE